MSTDFASSEKSNMGSEEQPMKDSRQVDLEENKGVHEESVATEEEVSEEDSQEPKRKSILRRIIDFYFANEFLISILAAIALAKAYPPLGATYLAPHITATWLAVVLIFVLSGLGLRTSEFSEAFKQLYFNVYVQVFNFGIVSASVYGITRLFIEIGALQTSLADGMVVCACMPMAINIVIVLTASTGGDEALAIFNTTFGNILGIFLSPVLILGYLGSSSDIALGEVFYKLTLRVVVPLVFGQILQKTSPAVVEFRKKHKRRFKKVQEYCLAFIVYTVFCRTFEADNNDAGLGDVFLMIFFQFVLMAAFMVLSWYSLRYIFPNKPKMHVTGLFGCCMKTVALGIPMINSIYEDDPALGLYALPLLIWHPMQLVIGTLITPRLATYIEGEEKRIATEQSGTSKAFQRAVTTLSGDEEAPASEQEDEK